MQCPEVVAELVSFAKEELTPEERATVQEHLAACAACQQELQSIQQTLAALRTELVPIELSAHFRMALAERLDKATHGADAPQETEPVFGHERQLSEMRKGVVIKLAEHARRSPYFGVSLILHAAALFVIVALLVRQPERERAPVIHTETILNHEEPQFSQEQARFQQRSLAYRIPTQGTRTPAGVQISVAGLVMSDRPLVLVGDKDLSCVRAYFTSAATEAEALDELRKDPETQMLLKENPGSQLCQMKDARIVIPNALVSSHLGDTSEFFVFELNNRLEIWAQTAWKSLEKKCAGSGFTAAVKEDPAAAIRLRREEKRGLNA